MHSAKNNHSSHLQNSKVGLTHYLSFSFTHTDAALAREDLFPSTKIHYNRGKLFIFIPRSHEHVRFQQTSSENLNRLHAFIFLVVLKIIKWDKSAVSIRQRFHVCSICCITYSLTGPATHKTSTVETKSDTFALISHLVKAEFKSKSLKKEHFTSQSQFQLISTEVHVASLDYITYG